MNLIAKLMHREVIGDVVVTRKDENLAGIKLLIVQPLTPEREPAGRPLVAVDAVGAGVGEEVFFVAARKRAFRSIRSSRRSTPASSASSITGISGERCDRLQDADRRSVDRHGRLDAEAPQVRGREAAAGAAARTSTTRRAARRCWRSTASAPACTRRCWSCSKGARRARRSAEGRAGRCRDHRHHRSRSMFDGDL